MLGKNLGKIFNEALEDAGKISNDERRRDLLDKLKELSVAAFQGEAHVDFLSRANGLYLNEGETSEEYKFDRFG